MTELNESPVTKRRRVAGNSYFQSPLSDSHSDSEVPLLNKMDEETNRISQMSISATEERAEAVTDYNHINTCKNQDNLDGLEDDGDDKKTEKNVENDGYSSDDSHDNIDNMANFSSISSLGRSSADKSSDSNEPEEVDDRRKLLIAINNLDCLDDNYFEVIADESSLTGTVIAKCKLCDPPKPFKGSLRTTSNFTTHLERCHKNNYGEYLKYSEEKRKGFDTNKNIDRKRWSCVFDQDQFEQNVAHLMLKFMVPFRAVEYPMPRKIFDDLQIKKNDCQLKHLIPYNLMNRVDKFYKKSVDGVRQAIRRVVDDGGYVCTTADVWTGGSRRFLGVTVSWIDP
ncbi:uncharacterized protein LOC130667486 [Microplitis mediator]|uniref:uncharacterized protein LOC130667486 n=1 Tax=Microplitis mediator TaxID=375433 RepID=UPI0025567CB3|nr:uncharacterized protein LOC130667486 [Microplitis mediator]